VLIFLDIDPGSNQISLVIPKGGCSMPEEFIHYLSFRYTDEQGGTHIWQTSVHGPKYLKRSQFHDLLENKAPFDIEYQHWVILADVLFIDDVDA
jgi:hypothetical protein